MGILFLFAVICALLWLLIAVLRGWISFGWLAFPTIVAALVILIGSVFGREFFCMDVGPLPITLDRMLWIWMIVQFGMLVLFQRVRLLPLNAIDVFVGALLLVLGFSTLCHDFTYRDHLPLTRLLFFNVVPIGIYFVVRHSPIGERQLRWILYGCVAFGAYLAATAIAEWRNWPQFVYPAYIMDASFSEFLGRARGPFLNPVVCGIFQIAGFVAALMLWPKLHTRGRMLIAVFLALFIVGVFATFTRSVWLALAVSVAIVFWLPASSRWRGGLLIGGASAAALLVALFSDDINAFKRDKNVTAAEMAESVQLRPLLANVAGQMFVDRPIFGHGFGQYSKAKRLYHQPVSNEPLKRVLPYMQHNVVLSYLTETGAVGTILLLGIFALYGVAALRVFYHSPQNSYRRAVGLLSLIILTSYLINGMFHDVSIMPMLGSLFYFMLGVINHLATTPIQLNALDATTQAPPTVALPQQRLAS